MKLKILLSNIFLPLLAGGLLFLLMKGYISVTINLLVAGSVTAGVLVRNIFWGRKYISRFVFREGAFIITSVNLFLKKFRVTMEVEKISNIRMYNTNFLIPYSSEIHLRYKGKWKDYRIIDREVYERIQAELTAYEHSLQAVH